MTPEERVKHIIEIHAAWEDPLPLLHRLFNTYSAELTTCRDPWGNVEGEDGSPQLRLPAYVVPGTSFRLAFYMVVAGNRINNFATRTNRR